MSTEKFTRNWGSLLIACLLAIGSWACSTSQPPVATQPVLQDSTKLLFTLPAEARFFTTDKLRQTYVVTPDNKLIKFDVYGQEAFRFTNNLFGELTYVDATNPFNLLLYYQEYLTILTLDRTLNLTGEIRLPELDLVEVKAVGLSNDNNVWLYDEQGRKLRKLDRYGKVLFETADLNQLLGTTIAPVQLLERDNRVFLNDPEHGIFIFDNFGQYLNTLDITNAKNLHYHQGFLFFEKDDKALGFELRTLEYNHLLLPTRADQWRVEGKKLFIRQGEKVMVFKQ